MTQNSDSSKKNTPAEKTDHSPEGHASAPPTSEKPAGAPQRRRRRRTPKPEAPKTGGEEGGSEVRDTASAKSVESSDSPEPKEEGSGTAPKAPASGVTEKEGGSTQSTRRRGGRHRRKRSAAPKPSTEASSEESAPAQPSAAAGRSEEAVAEASAQTGAVQVKETGAVQEKTAEGRSSATADSATAPEAEAPADQTKAPPAKKRRRRGGRGRRRSTSQAEPARETEAPVPQAAIPQAAAEKSAVPPAPTAGDEMPFPEATSIRSDERVMLINVAEDEECRIAVVYQNRLEELFIERASGRSHVGNIYKGRVTNVEPSIQAAFVDFGCGRNGFLHISDLQPQYFPEGQRHAEKVGRKTPRRERPPIQRCLRRGQEIIVQVIKEGIGTKGPTLSSYISIPGRYLVMMPGMHQLGVSRKIEDEEIRGKMRRMLEELDLPKTMGFILRTAGVERTKTDLRRDLRYLERLWKLVTDRIKHERAPCELYQESDLVIRTIRDVYSSDFNRVIVDSRETAGKARDFLNLAMPRSAIKVELYSGRKPLYYEYGIEQEIDRLHQRRVELASGGSLVIDSTEAMVTIDVNSGRCREHSDAEQTAFKINMEAAEEIARQLRLRDLGGLILCDFIDMRLDKHKRAVERAMRDAMRKHKERAKALRLSQFCIMEMTRQRMRPPIKGSVYQECPHCCGAGMIKNAESMTLDLVRMLRIATTYEQVKEVLLRVPPRVALDLQNNKRAEIHELEQVGGISIVIQPDQRVVPDRYEIECFDARGSAVRAFDLPCHPPAETPPRLAAASEIQDTHPEAETLEDLLD